jgi:hypothetical protein
VKYQVQYLTVLSGWQPSTNPEVKDKLFDSFETAWRAAQEQEQLSVMGVQYRVAPVEELAEVILSIAPLDKNGFDGFAVITNQQKIELGIANHQDCCESWGHFWTNDITEVFIGAKLLGVSVVDGALYTTKLDKLQSLDEGEIMFVNLETNRGILQFTAYNSHNGYYGHTAYVKSTQLNHEVTV